MSNFNKENQSRAERRQSIPGVVISVILSLLFFAVSAIFLFIATAGAQLSDWYKETFHTSFREIIYTYDLGLEGANASFIGDAFKGSTMSLILFGVIFVLLIVLDILVYRLIKKNMYEHRHILRFLFRAVVLAVLILCAVPNILYADKLLKVSDFIKSRYSYTKLYDERYIDPDDVEISSPGTKRNVIIIYLESLESSYASKELGGALPTSVIPKLTGLAFDNTSFGDRTGNELRGIHNPSGTTWTTASIMASSSGVPFAFNVGKNQMGKDGTFASGLDTLGDFLKDEGYYQEFLCGSESEFGGKKQFFMDHGDFDIFDFNTAVEKGYVAREDFVWWGLEDHKLYEIAKDELTRISKTDEPFNFTMLTVDTHHVGGYKCEWCPTTYKRDLANIIACADNQAYDFIEWCKEQDFYENTTIVVMGDHPRMDNQLVDRLKKFDRCSYDCFINPAKTAVNKNRLAATMDLFPTILSSMGYTIEGDRLGLGTDLFSDTPTLAEEMGYDNMNDELKRNSRFYQKNFR